MLNATNRPNNSLDRYQREYPGRIIQKKKKDECQFQSKCWKSVTCDKEKARTQRYPCMKCTGSEIILNLANRSLYQLIEVPSNCDLAIRECLSFGLTFRCVGEDTID